MNKICKQCGRNLPIDSFHKYAARGRGIYTTTQGHHTICKDCESISRRADRALKNNNIELIEKLRTHYKSLQDRGLEPVTAPARRLLGVEKPKANSIDTLLAAVQTISVTELVDNIRNRKYANADEAYEAHKPYIDELREVGMLTEVTELIEEWYDDEEQNI